MVHWSLGCGKIDAVACGRRGAQGSRPSGRTLDGDEIRQRLSRGLGFSKEDRDENIRRIGFVARLLSRNGAVAIAAAISPYRELRDEVRREHEAPFVEIFVSCPLDVLIKRDPKGLYAKALRGRDPEFQWHLRSVRTSARLAEITRAYR